MKLAENIHLFEERNEYSHRCFRDQASCLRFNKTKDIRGQYRVGLPINVSEKARSLHGRALWVGLYLVEQVE